MTPDHHQPQATHAPLNNADGGHRDGKQPRQAHNPPHADPSELAELDALADELNQLGFPALRLTPPGKLPYVDTGLPQGMTPGERIYSQAGTYFWPGAEPIAPSDQPATAAAIISHTLRPGTPQP